MKPTVRYIDVVPPVVVGAPANVLPIDHPTVRINRGWVRTSPVLNQRPGINGPVFETRNTIYVPEETDESLPRATSKETHH